MKEKERYEYFFGTNTIKDNKTNQFYGYAVDLLNQQDKRIKELEQENQQLKQQLADTEEMRLENLNDGCRCVERDSEMIVKLQQESQQLKQQLTITEKALELASETIKQMCGKPLWIGGNIPSPEPKDSKYFKDIAKEMLENE